MANDMESNKICIATFYKFIDLSDCVAYKKNLESFCLANKIKGTAILASEGLTATFAGDAQSMNNLVDYFNLDQRFCDIHLKYSTSDFNPFKKLKVKIKTEVVKFDDNHISVKNHNAKYVEPDMWGGFMSRADFIIDVRNIYEVERGSFVNSINPLTKVFSEFPVWAKKWSASQKNKEVKIGMSCTGGIRCEKAAACLNDLGFDNVYQLKGGVLQYLKTTQNKTKQWIGDCFVFDNRIAVDDNLEPSKTICCYNCSEVVSLSNIWLNSKGRALCSLCRDTKFQGFFYEASTA